jgi:S1-C subfamily serine protease
MYMVLPTIQLQQHLQILRNDLKRELLETRRFMNLQCLYYNDKKYEDNSITRTLISGKSSSCPLVSDEDAKMLWQSMTFMREASDRYSNLIDQSTTIPTMFYFLERLLVHAGVFLPLRVSQNASLEQSEVFFVPSLLSQADPANMWTYMTSDSWMTTLCHSWLFRDGAPPSLIEHITVQILRNLYEFSHNGEIPNREAAHRIHSAPVTKKSFDAVEKQADVVGRVQIHHVVCFKSSMLIKIGTVFTDDKSGNLRESFVEVFVAVVDQTSLHTVASDVMRPCMQRVVVSGKGQLGRHGYKLWNGGYKVVFESVQNTLSTLPNVDEQAICPECLATSSPRIASTWGWDVVSAAAKSGNPHVVCLRGHRVNSNLVCGTIPEKKSAPLMDHQSSSQRVTKSLNIKDTLPSVVLVGVWDPISKCVISVGSGFIVDKKAGFIVTAGHVMFSMDHNSALFGIPYFGCRGARAVIAIIPNRDSKHAIFRYFAEIVASNVRHVDACILQIRSRMENDVDGKDVVGAINQPEKPLSLEQISGEDLRSLKLTKQFDIAESVRLLGYSQEGEGMFAMGKHISPSVEFVEGRIHRLFKATRTEDCFDSDSSSTASNNSHHRQNAFTPQEEIVLHCLVNSGHSGGPCVNSEGKVVGILSRSDPVQRDRCYLVPTSELRPLIVNAKATCLPRPARISTMQTM